MKSPDQKCETLKIQRDEQYVAKERKSRGYGPRRFTLAIILNKTLSRLFVWKRRTYIPSRIRGVTILKGHGATTSFHLLSSQQCREDTRLKREPEENSAACARLASRSESCVALLVDTYQYTTVTWPDDVGQHEGKIPESNARWRYNRIKYGVYLTDWTSGDANKKKMRENQMSEKIKDKKMK